MVAPGSTHKAGIPQSMPPPIPIAPAYAMDAPAIPAGSPLTTHVVFLQLREVERHKLLKAKAFSQYDASFINEEFIPHHCGEDLLTTMKTVEAVMIAMNARVYQLEAIVEAMHREQTRLTQKLEMLEAHQTVLDGAIHNLVHRPGFV